MSPFFTKQLEAIELDDVNQLIGERFPEGDIVEYKESLPHSKGGLDPWYTGDPKIRLQARDCIEPQLPVIATWGVEADPGGAGVVIIRVPQSRAAPHRLKPTRDCYYRRNDRSEMIS